MKTITGVKAEANVKDFSLVDPNDESGPRHDGSETKTVPYTFDHNVYASVEESKYSPAEILELINRAEKATANSAARAKAIAPYAIPTTDPRFVKNRMIQDAMKLSGMTLEAATKFVDSLTVAV